MLFGNVVDRLHLLRSHSRQMSRMVDRPDNRRVGEFVQLLDLLTVYVDPSGQSENLRKPRLVDFPGDQLRGRGQLVQQSGELPCRVQVLPLLLDDSPGEHRALFHVRP